MARLSSLQGQSVHETYLWLDGGRQTLPLADLVWVADLLVPKSRSPVRVMLHLDDSGWLAFLREVDESNVISYAKVVLMSPDYSTVYAVGSYSEEAEVASTFAYRQHTMPGIINPADYDVGLGAMIYYGGALGSALVGGPGTTYSPELDRTDAAGNVWRKLVKLGIATKREDPVQGPVNLLDVNEVFHSGMILAVNNALIDLEGCDLLMPPTERVATLDLTYTSNEAISYWLSFLGGRDLYTQQYLGHGYNARYFQELRTAINKVALPKDRMVWQAVGAQLSLFPPQAYPTYALTAKEDLRRLFHPAGLIPEYEVIKEDEDDKTLWAPLNVGPPRRNAAPVFRRITSLPPTADSAEVLADPQAASYEISTLDSRVDVGNDVQLASGLRVCMQKVKHDRECLVSLHNGREFLYLVDAAGRGCYVYRSFMGTTNKAQGTWYPCGGALASKSGIVDWIIKGDPEKDPGYGRPALAAMVALANKVLPHSDADVDSFLTALSGMHPRDLFRADPEIVPYLRATVPLGDKSKEERAEAHTFCFHIWRVLTLTRAWGPRVV